MSGGGKGGDDSTAGLARELSNRHIQLIAIGGAIGTGLFMGAGKTIHASGSSVLLTYLIVGGFLFFVMRALGELLLSNLEFKNFADLTAYYLGDWAGFSVGWTYWMTQIVGAVAALVVLGGYCKFWFPQVSGWMPGTVTLAAFFVSNLLAVRLFGEFEFWFAMIKVAAILALVVVGGSMIAVGFVSPDGVKASLTHIVGRGVMFPNGMEGFFSGFQIAIYSFAGIELLGITAAEAKDPRHTLPQAINGVPVRILLFYVLSLACIIGVSSWRKVVPDQSPFVRFFVLAGLPAAAGVVNFIVMTSAMSAINTGVFSTSRILFGLAAANGAPTVFLRLSGSAVPAVATVFSSCCMLLGVGLLLAIPDLMTVFTIITTVAATLFIFVWSMILLSYLAHRRKRPDLHRQSTFKMPAGVLMSWASLLFFGLCVILLARERDTRTTLLLTPIWFAGLSVMYVCRMAGKRRGRGGPRAD